MIIQSRRAISRLWKVLDRAEKRSLALLFLVSVLTSVAELGLLAAVVPFSLAFSSAAGGESSITGSTLTVRQAGLLFLLAIALATAMRLAALRVQANCAKRIAEYLAVRSYRKALNRPYVDHMRTNSSHVIATITSRLDMVIQAVIFSAISGLNQLILSVSIVAALFLADARVTSIILVSVIGAYSIFLYRSRSIVGRESVRHNEALSSITWVTSESLRGVRDVLLSGTQAKWLASYREAQHVLRDANARLSVASATPRIVVEAIGFVVIVVIACILAETFATPAGAVPILAVVILGSQRLLPVAQGLFVSWNNFKSGLPHLLDVLPFLEQPDASPAPAAAALPLRRSIELSGLSYTYPGTSTPVLEDAGLIIETGMTVGIVGRTGCGKSTLLDLMMGLLSPDQGELIIDGVPLSADDLPRWQRAISHVAQNIYLADATIAENIALGSAGPEIDREAVQEAGRLADLDSFVRNLPLGYDTEVGEHGVRLSGGQRQRVGIARALYRRSDILILDEATSSLDQETEANVMRSIGEESEARTILIVTHRLTTLAICDRIYRMADGRLVGPIAYSDLVGPRHSISA